MSAGGSRVLALDLGEVTIGVAPDFTVTCDKFAEALTYLRNQWDALQLYLSDGRLPIENNEVEQLMKQIALGRKNWLFIGSVAAGQRAAVDPVGDAHCRRVFTRENTGARRRATPTRSARRS